jgi:soluble lytic murein transglycosylase-like protein
MIPLVLLFLPPKTVQAYEEPVAGINISLEVYSSITAVKELSPIETYINYYSAVYGVDSDLIKAIVDGESNGDVQAYNTNDNGTHDKGLMQINSCNYEWLEGELGITDFYDAKQNIQAGTYIISLLTAKYLDLHRVLMSYNMGETRTRELWNGGVYSSSYSREVMKKFNKLKEEKK